MRNANWIFLKYCTIIATQECRFFSLAYFAFKKKLSKLSNLGQVANIPEHTEFREFRKLGGIRGY